MKAIKRIIVNRYNPETASRGWIPLDCPLEFSGITEGSFVDLLCHDLLEHQPNEKGTCEEELKALGAVLYGRAQFQHLKLIGNIGFLIGELINSGDFDVNNIKYPDINTRDLKKEFGCYISDLGDNFYCKFKRELSANNLELSEKVVRKLFIYVYEWLLVGLDEVCSRYGDSLMLYDCFVNLSDELKSFIKDFSEYNLAYVNIDENGNINIELDPRY